MSFRGFLLLGGVCGLALLGGGCAPTTYAMSPNISTERGAGTEVLEEGAASRELASAQRMLRAGDYSLVIPKLMHISTRYPTTQAATDARYFLGMAYYRIGGLREAVDNYNKYLERAPDGKYAPEVREYVATLSDEVERTTVTREDLARRIVAVEDRGAAQPLAFHEQLELADLYWKSGEYDRAGAMYQEMLEEWPQLESDSTIRTRIERTPAGEYVILTPQEVAQRYEESEPLVIFNTNAFRSGRFEGYHPTSRERFYNVTGEVINRGSDALTNVQVFVTIYGFGSMIYDTQTVTIGRLRPGERRAFSARFSGFDDIERVSRFECVGTYQRQG